MAKRTVEEIRQEYSNLCTKAGHINYQISTLQSDLNALNASMKDLNLEAAAVAAEASEAPPQQAVAESQEQGVANA